MKPQFDEFEDLKPKKSKLTKNSKKKKLTFYDLEDTITDKFYYNDGYKKSKKFV